MQSTDSQDLPTYDVVVVGGALTLARVRRSVLVVDAGEPRNAPASAVHGFLTRDGTSPQDLLRAGRDEVRRYGAELLDGRVASAERTGDGFAVTLDDGRRVGARRLLVTTGLVDELPEVTGIRERWGRDVLHCPYCHGWEVRDRQIGVLGTGPMSVHQALLFRQLSGDVVFFSHTAASPTDEQAEQLAARSIGVVEGEVTSLEVAGDRLAGVRLADGRVIVREALTISPRFVARGEVLAGLGVEATVHPLGEYVQADEGGLTAVPGVWVAGNVADPLAQIVGAADGGARAGAAINADLVAEEARDAVAARRDPAPATAEGGR